MSQDVECQATGVGLYSRDTVLNEFTKEPCHKRRHDYASLAKPRNDMPAEIPEI